jgi:hypothetical protein
MVTNWLRVQLTVLLTYGWFEGSPSEGLVEAT